MRDSVKRVGPRIIALVVCALLMGLAGCRSAPQHAAAWGGDRPDGGRRFHTFYAAFSLREGDTPAFIEYLEAARPEVVQIGWYGPMFHGYAHNPRSTGYPMQLPVAGEREALTFQTRLNKAIHAVDPAIKIIGHFQMSTVIDQPDEPFGFIKWYQEAWNEALMGPRPVADVAELLQRDAAGHPIRSGGYIDFIDLCISSPHTRRLLKRMVEIAIDTGVDGLMSNYNYRRGCVCHWCQAAFKTYLRQRYDAGALRARFGIDDLETHVFNEIPARMPGYPDPETAGELHWAAADWGARHFKQVFDEILIDHGRSIKPDLVVATWNHRAFIPHHDERAFTPIADWHRGEDYFWYSGAHDDGKLADGVAGDAWPHLLWLREMVDGKPFMIGRYTRRIRVALAEGLATGGAGTGLYHPIADPESRRAMIRHHQFVHAHRELYDAATPRSEVAIVLPRQSALNRRPESYPAVRRIAQTLAQQRVLYDFLLDQRLESAADRLARYPVLVLPGVLALSDAQIAVLREYVAGGGAVLVVGDLAIMDAGGVARDPVGVFDAADAAGIPQPVRAGRVAELAMDRLDAIMERLEELTVSRPLSRIEAAWTLRAAAFDRPRGMALHLVNYDRDEAAGVHHARPARDVTVALNVPAGTRIATVTWRSPDIDAPRRLTYRLRNGRLRLTVPEIEVYGVVDIRFAGRR